MHLRWSSSGLPVDRAAPLPGATAFLDAVCRGVGQVMLQDNSYAGILFLAGIFWNSPVFGLGALIGTVASTATALLFGADRMRVRRGLFGFNGALTAIALLYFLEPGALTWACVVFAAGCSTILMAAMLTVLDTWKMPVLTAPFVFTVLCFFLATARFGRLQSTGMLPTAGLPGTAAVEGIVTLPTVAEGLFNGLAEVFFQGNIVTGVLFAAGLLIASRRACVVAFAGSLAGILVAWGMGAAEPAIRAGAFGFNSVLTAIALGSVFLAPGRLALVYALLAAAVTAIVFAAVSAALEPLGMPALTLPFVLVTWAFLFAGRAFARLPAASAN